MSDSDFTYLVFALAWIAALGIGGLLVWIAQRLRRNARACGRGFEHGYEPRWRVGVASRPSRMGGGL